MSGRRSVFTQLIMWKIQGGGGGGGRGAYRPDNV